MPTKNLEDVAIVINPQKDNVAVVTADCLEEGTEVKYGNERIVISDQVPCGQSFAIKRIRKGQAFISLGDPTGLASRTVEPGDPVDERNLLSRLPRLRVRYRDNPAPTPIDPRLASLTFDGYVRPDGSVGVRNYVGVVTSGMCSSAEVREIASRATREIYTRDKFPHVDGVVPVVHESGCGMPDGHAVDLVNRILTNVLRHPNFGAALYVDLGCGKTCVECSASER